MIKTHSCNYMIDVGGYCYVWGDCGWQLHFFGEPKFGRTWRSCCDWCGLALPDLSEPPADFDPLRSHRCRGLIELEWVARRAEVAATAYTVKWDGFEWVWMDGSQVKSRRLPTCPGCKKHLGDPRIIHNEVIIS